MGLTARELLDLRPGARLRVVLRGGREVAAELTGSPSLVSTGKPGIARVRLSVVDIEAAARVARSEPKHTAFGSNPFACLKARHEVTGAQVLAIV